MAKKQTFKMSRRDADPVDVDYYPIVYLHGSDAWRLALHREPVLAGKGEWIVSDPISGYRVCRITAAHKGMPVSSRDLGVAQARQAALLQLDVTVERVGAERFAQVLRDAQAGNPPTQKPTKSTNPENAHA
mgnify:CR=1 FL=1